MFDLLLKFEMVFWKVSGKVFGLLSGRMSGKVFGF